MIYKISTLRKIRPWMIETFVAPGIRVLAVDVDFERKRSIKNGLSEFNSSRGKERGLFVRASYDSEKKIMAFSSVSIQEKEDEDKDPNGRFEWKRKLVKEINKSFNLKNYMDTKKFEAKVLEKGLEPLEARHGVGKEIRWFICRSKTHMIVYDSVGQAYSAEYSEEVGDEVTFADDKPIYAEKSMQLDNQWNI